MKRCLKVIAIAGISFGLFGLVIAAMETDVMRFVEIASMSLILVGASAMILDLVNNRV